MNLIIRASAGTGKTFRLSNRYLELTADGAAPDSILATTFTKKAAGEILDRILSRLAEAALSDEKAGELGRFLGDEAFDRAKATALLRTLIRRLHRLRVSTLDSFFIDVAKTFSLELSLPLGWQIVEETTDTAMRERAIFHLLQEGEQAETIRLMHQLNQGDVGRALSEQISGTVRSLYSLYLDSTEEAWHRLARRKTPEGSEVKEALAAIEVAASEASKSWAKAMLGDLENFNNQNWDQLFAKGIASKVAAGETHYSRKEIPEPLKDAYTIVLDVAKAQIVNLIVAKNEAAYELMRRFDEVFRPLKASEHAMRFEDVTRMLAGGELSRYFDSVGFRLDAEIDHLLLDEFQDTSSEQWAVLSPFAQVVNRTRSGSFFCVGDVKQAIYGWRGGIAEIFETVDGELSDVVHEGLNLSFRSSQPVIDAVNQVFSGLARNEALTAYPVACKKWADRFEPHATARKELPGYVCAVTTRTVDKDREEKDADVLVEETVTLVQDTLARRGDIEIGVLCRTNKMIAPIAYRLRKAGIEVSEEGANPLTESPAVEILLSLCKLADHPGDTVARAHVVSCGKFDLSDYHDDAAAARLSHEIRARFLEDGYAKTLHAWARRLMPQCDPRDARRVEQFLNLAHRWEPRATSRVDDFVRFIEEFRVESPAEAPVRIMTVHKSKGLQFDMVVLPIGARSDLSGAMTPSYVSGRPVPTAPVDRVCAYVGKKTRPVLPRETAALFDDFENHAVTEALCVLYVAVTRAKNALHVLIPPESVKTKTGTRRTAAAALGIGLAPDGLFEAETVFYEGGDPKWLDKLPAPSAETREPAPVLEIRLAPGTGRRRRGLKRQSPSSMEGGGRIRLDGRLRRGGGTARVRGLIVHAWFEQIGWLEEGAPDDASLLAIAKTHACDGLDLPQMLADFRSRLAKSTVRTALLRATYTRPGGLPGCRACAGPSVKAPRWEIWSEREFLLREEDTLVPGAIDRVTILYDGERAVGAEVLDFKTDAVDPNDPEAMAEKTAYYAPQLTAYRRAVARLLGLDETAVSTRLAFVEADVLSEP